MAVKNAAGTEQTWTLDLKNAGSVAVGAEGKPDIVISLSDDTFLDLSSGKLNGQKAFMSGKLKVKGNMGLAMKLDTVLKSAKSAPAPKAAAPAAAAPASKSGSVAVPGFESSATFVEIQTGIASLPQSVKEATVKKVKGVFQFDVKSAEGKVQTWTIDLKNGTGDIGLGVGSNKPDVTIAVADKDFVDLANGKLNGQKAFMQGKIKVKGNVMLATKLDTVLKDLKPKAKL
jgi:putative sterol carrier protein